MKRRIYSIRDKKADTFIQPVLFDNDAVATRAFGDLVLNDKASMISQHPSDFQLCFIGEFDCVTGAIKSVPVVAIADGDNFIKE